MPKRLFEQAQVTLNGYDIGADISGAELLGGRRAPVDVTGLSDTWDSFLVPNIRKWGVRLPFFNNFDVSSSGSSIVAGVNVVLKTVLNSTATSGVQFVLRATTGVRSAANPEWSGYVQLDGDYQITAGNVAEADQGTVMLKGLGALSFFTSAT